MFHSSRSFILPNRGALLWWLAPSKEGQALERLAQGFHPGLEALEALEKTGEVRKL